MTELGQKIHDRLSRLRSGGWIRPLLGAADGVLLAVGIVFLGSSLLVSLDGIAHNRLQIERMERLRGESTSTDGGSASSSASSPRPSPMSEGPLMSPAKAAGSLAEGALVGTLRVRRLELEVAILAGTSRETLRRGVGHIPGTAAPGGDGNVGLAGHRDGFFWGLQELRVGDRIEIVTPTGSHAYLAESIRIVEPDDVEVLDDRPGRDLTLVTCYPFTFLGFAPQRYIVHARTVEAGGPEAAGWAPSLPSPR